MERLLTSLKTKEVEIATLHQQAEKERDEVAKQNQELQKERQQAKAEMNNMVRESRDRVVVEAAELSRQIRQAESELRKEKSRERLKQAKETITAVRQQLDTGPLQPATGDTVAPQPEESRIIVGDVVTIRDVGLKATVLSIAEDRHEAEVQAGQTRLKLGLDRIEKATPLESKIVTMATPIKLRRAERPVSRELDLRGKRAEEIQPILEQYLNDASVTNQSEVRIIHGFGTGTVRQIVRESLAAHPLVKSFRAGKQNEGGDGVTIVQL
jgi:DNA mismatch repair protein MutS2